MILFSTKVLLGLSFLGLVGCGVASSPASFPSQATNSESPSVTLRRIVDRYWDVHVTDGYALSPQSMADSLAVERHFLADVLAVSYGPLDAQSRLTYDLFRKQRELTIEGFIYPTELLPVNPFDAMPLQLAHTVADMRQHPLRSAKAYESWLQQIDSYVRWTNQAIVNMRDGIRRGYTSPKVLMERTLPMLQTLGEDNSANVFYIPLQSMPSTIKEPERTRLLTDLNGAVKEKLLPAYRELHDFIAHEYLPHARSSTALSALPLGPSWYSYRVKRATGSRLTPTEIHNIGVTEVEHIRARILSLPINALSAAVGANSSAEELLAAYQQLKVRTLAAMPTLFSVMPLADFQILANSSLDMGAAPVAYERAVPQIGTPATLYINTNSDADQAGVQVASFLSEAMPGRHYQSAIQQEHTELPKFRRFGSEPAFADGWALYAASLGEELGLLHDDADRRQQLFRDLQCAVALVVDTGLHAQDWTRAQAVDYLRAQLAVDADEAALMADRFVALPGDALACKLGELKIRALRNRAQQTLGSHFDIREFHSEILKDGPMPLDSLDSKMTLWMDAEH